MIDAVWQRALATLGYRQQAYKSAFEGSAQHQVLVDLARFSGAFSADTAGLSNDELREMTGRRQMFFRIINHLKLTPQEIEAVYRPALIAAAAKLQRQQGADE